MEIEHIPVSDQLYPLIDPLWVTLPEGLPAPAPASPFIEVRNMSKIRIPHLLAEGKRSDLDPPFLVEASLLLIL